MPRRPSARCASGWRSVTARDAPGRAQAVSALAEVGHGMIDPARAVELRRRGCVWLSRFPSTDTAKKLAALVGDASEPVREQAIWALGYRQLRAMHPATLWPQEAIQIAD